METFIIFLDSIGFPALTVIVELVFGYLIIKNILQQIQPHDLLKYGIIPELVGRLPVITALNALNRQDLVRILTEPKNALVKQYQKLME